jgi:glucokinase
VSPTARILAGDIGGTKTVLSLYEGSPRDLRQVREETYPSQQYDSLDEILEVFLKEEGGPPPRALCLGVAGAVIEGKSDVTNLPWRLDETALKDATGVSRVKLLNDLESAAYGMLHSRGDDLSVLNRGAEPARKGNRAVIAAGTGLGEAILYWDGAEHRVMASEGGHSDFAPRTDEEIELLKYLRQQYGGHVSYERVLSGPGFFNIYCFLRDAGYAPEPDSMKERIESGDDPSAVVTEAGLEDRDPLSVRTLELFATLYGAEAGNLALKCLAVGGVYVGGGIAPKILPTLKAGPFMKGFTDKGRFSDLVASMPVSVALNPRVPLLGAAYYALRL